MAAVVLRSLAVGVLLAGVAGSVSACAKAQARTPPATPAPAAALAMPSPEPRLVVPVRLDPPPAPEPAPAPPAPAATPPARGRETPARPPAAPAVPPPAPVPAEPPPVLQTSTSVAELEARALSFLAQAERDLRLVPVASLSRDARAQYDSARRFALQSRDAMAAKNFVYALQLADKAATLAALIK
jgi:hypothetical protein